MVHGTRGTLVCKNTFRTQSQRLTGRPRLEIIGPSGTSTRTVADVKCYKEEIERFNRCIMGDGEPMTTGGDGLINIAIAEAIYESSRKGKVVTLAETIGGYSP